MPESVAPTRLLHSQVNQNRIPWRCITERAAGTGATRGPAVNPCRSMPASRQYATVAQQAASAHWWVRTVSLALDGVVLNKCMVLVPSPMTGTNHARQHPGQCHHLRHPCQITREPASPPFSTWHDHSIRVGGSGAGAKLCGHPRSAVHGLSCGGSDRHHAGENACVITAQTPQWHPRLGELARWWVKV